MAETLEKHEQVQDRDQSKPEPGTGHLGRTFLVGETIYLRPLEKADAASSVALRDTVYPVSPQRTEEWIKETTGEEHPGKKQNLAVVRKADDVIVGSIRYDSDGWVLTWINVHIAPLFDDQGQRWKAEAIILLVDHLIQERQRPAVMLEQSAGEEIVVRELLAAGMVETARFRQSRRMGDRFVDLLALQKFNPDWLETLGNPMDMPLERTGTGQPRPVPVKIDPLPAAPKNAIMVGKRVYLRPISKEDPKVEVPWTRKETETFFDIGRHLPSIGGIQNWYTDLEKKETPDWIHIAVCLRENDQYIGNVMLIGVDYINKRAETGSWFFRGDYRGSGYGSEAKHLLLEYAFEVLGLHMVQSWVYFPNTRSAAALRKQGYRECGRICWVYPYEAGFSNFVVFDLLADEWRGMPRKDWE
jgi:RimJ/RimL family protein N-acetyltransferase